MAAVTEHTHWAQQHVRQIHAPYVRRSSASQNGHPVPTVPQPDQLIRNISRATRHSPHRGGQYSSAPQQRCAYPVDSEAEPSWALGPRAAGAWEQAQQHDREAYLSGKQSTASFNSTSPTTPIDNSPNTYYGDRETAANAAPYQHYYTSNAGPTTLPRNAYYTSQAQCNRPAPTHQRYDRENPYTMYQQQTSNRTTTSMAGAFPSSDLAPDWLDDTDTSSYDSRVEIVHHRALPGDATPQMRGANWPPQLMVAPETRRSSTGYCIASLSAPELPRDHRRVSAGSSSHNPAARPTYARSISNDISETGDYNGTAYVRRDIQPSNTKPQARDPSEAAQYSGTAHERGSNTVRSSNTHQAGPPTSRRASCPMASSAAGPIHSSNKGFQPQQY